MKKRLVSLLTLVLLGAISLGGCVSSQDHEELRLKVEHLEAELEICNEESGYILHTIDVTYSKLTKDESETPMILTYPIYIKLPSQEQLNKFLSLDFPKLEGAQSCGDYAEELNQRALEANIISGGVALFLDPSSYNPRGDDHIINVFWTSDGEVIHIDYSMGRVIRVAPIEGESYILEGKDFGKVQKLQYHFLFGSLPGFPDITPPDYKQ